MGAPALPAPRRAPPVDADEAFGSLLAARAPVVVRRRHGVRRPWRERLAQEDTILFVALFAAYLCLGYWVTVRWHVIPGDGLSRLSHAYFALYGDPPKLAAIGFEWPPLDTLVLMPFAVIKPLATSLWALPLSTAAFGAGMIVVLNRALAAADMGRLARYGWLAAFAANPMIAYYSVNGMAEVPYLFFLTLTVYLFLRWYQTGVDGLVILMGLTLSVDFLARFELLAWAPLYFAAVGIVLYGQRATPERMEGTLLATMAPLVFAVMLWCMFNTLIVGDPLHWLKIQTEANIGGAPLGAASPHSLGAILSSVWSVNWRMFMLAPVVAVALVALAVIRRDVIALILATTVALNAVMTISLLISHPSSDLLRLRYNMRAMPLAVIGAAWLFQRARRRWARAAVYATGLALMAGSIPLAAGIMKQGRLTYYEDAFVRAVQVRHSQEGSDPNLRRGHGLGIAPEHDMSAFIAARTLHGRHRILTDDTQTFAVMLLTGHPEWFSDRIDHGDARFTEELARPYVYEGTPARGHYVRAYDYFLVSTLSDQDRIALRYRGAASGAVPWLAPVHSSGLYALLAVADPHTLPPDQLRALSGQPAVALPGFPALEEPS